MYCLISKCFHLFCSPWYPLIRYAISSIIPVDISSLNVRKQLLIAKPRTNRPIRTYDGPFFTLMSVFFLFLFSYFLFTYTSQPSNLSRCWTVSFNSTCYCGGFHKTRWRKPGHATPIRTQKFKHQMPVHCHRPLDTLSTVDEKLAICNNYARCLFVFRMGSFPTRIITLSSPSKVHICFPHTLNQEFVFDFMFLFLTV